MKIQNRQQANSEYDMLLGNVNRMFLTKDITELDNMLGFAQERLNDLYEYHRKRIEQKERSEK